MISAFGRILMAVIFVGFCGGCASFGKKKTAQPVGDTFQYCGAIASANPKSSFVVIDAGGFALPPAGAELIVRRDGQQVAKLRGGSEVRRPFSIADIVQGNPQTGDGVWLKN
ncbi:MAG TPA: hypothetical protein VIT91_10800 [Chthoniobacterales bacterium]